MSQDSETLEVAMAITRNTDTGKVLIIRKAAEYRDQDRYARTPWEVPGGKIEEQDHDSIDTALDAAAQAARRELGEETRITGQVVDQAEPYTTRQSGKAITFYPVLLETDETDVTLADSHEHDAYRWISVDTVGAFLTEHEQEAFDRLTSADG